jgi:hypothetical protein
LFLFGRSKKEMQELEQQSAIALSGCCTKAKSAIKKSEIRNL